MAIKIQFDPTHNPETPTMILAKKSGEKLGQLDPKSISIKDDLNNPSEITFSVNKYVDGKKTNLWDKIVDFKLLWCVEWDMWFEITIDIDESTETVKNVYCTELSQAELSQVMLYNIEINTETDISRDDYKNPTIFYNFETPSESLLHRITEKARHYKIVHVDASIAKIQRTFSFDNISLYDALMQIAEEIDCLFVFNSSSDSNGNIQRSISVYDLESNCKSCGHRGQFTSVCPECGSSNITEGYGDDTTIFVDSEELASDIQLTTDTGSVKNCFKLAGGDDLMTATIRNCNPNGTDYIWYLSKSDKEDMSSILVSKLDDYDVLYQMYLKDYVYNLDNNMVSKYNELINKYTIYDNTLETVLPSIQSYPALMKVYYNTVDFELYLKSELMPDAELSDTSAESQVALLIGKNMSPVATTNIAYLSSATADSVVTQMARAIVDSRYKIEILSSSLTKGVSTCTWTGVFKVTNYSDEEDTATGNSVTITINDNYKTFVEQKLTKALHDKETKDLSIVGLFNMPFASFKNELKKYCLNSLTSFHDACQACIDILIEQDISNASTWSGQNPNLYNDVYVPYYNMLQALEEEMQLRESEIAIISGIKDSDGNVITKGLQTYILELVTSTQKALDFQSYLGENLWKEFVTYRRESKYENSNYVSDGLNNAELFSRALEFIEVAQKEIYKSAELQHSITASLKNLLLMKKFEPLVDYFSVGNWLRIQIDDSIYKLRLLSYEINFDSLENISVEFSDVFKTTDGTSDQQSIISRTKNMTTSYSSTQRQANQGAKSSKILKGWSQSGLNTATTKIMCEASGQTQTWDEHGMLFRKYDTVTETYSDIQMKIINSTLALTDNNWKTTKTALGLFKYNDPETGELTEAYGINGEVIIGRILLGEQLGIYNEAGTLKFNKDGFVITNGVNSFTVNPNNAKKLLALSTPDADILYVDEKGLLHIQGDGAGLDISANSTVSGLSTRITANAEGLSAEISRAKGVEGELSTNIQANAEGISAEITRAKNAESGLSSSISSTKEELTNKIQINAEGLSAEIARAKGVEGDLSTSISATAESIRTEVKNTTDGLDSKIDQTASEIRQEVTDKYNGLDSKITQTANSITSTVSQKVGKDEVISAINQSAESITISASKINLQGAVTFSCLDNDAQNQITTAQSTANSASSAASSAQSTANSASSLASSAQSLASSANSTINSWGYGTSNTYINGGMIYTHSITTDELATDAIQSQGYVAGTGTYSTTGTFFNLADGSIKSPNFAIDSSGSAYFKGALFCTTGYIGGMSIFNKHIGTGEAGLSCDGTKEEGNTSGWELWAYEGAFRVADGGTTYITTLNNSYSSMTVGGTVTFTGTVDMSGATVKLPSDFNTGGEATDPTYGTKLKYDSSTNKLSLLNDNSSVLSSVVISSSSSSDVNGANITPNSVETTTYVKVGSYLTVANSIEAGKNASGESKFIVRKDTSSGVEINSTLTVYGGVGFHGDTYIGTSSANHNLIVAGKTTTVDLTATGTVDFSNATVIGLAGVSLQIDGKTYSNNLTSYNLATQSWVTGQGYLTSHQSLSSYATIKYVDSKYAGDVVSAISGQSVKLYQITPSGTFNGEKVLPIIGSLKAQGNLSCTGDVWCTGAVHGSNISDERLKNIIFDIGNVYKDLFMQIKPIAFTWKDKNIDTKIHFGVGAQTIEKSINEFGIDSSNIGIIKHRYFDSPNENTGLSDQYYVNYDEIYMLTIPVVQEHEREIIELKNQILLLQGEISILKQKMEEMQNA